jgi:hypothetical protein
VHEGDRQPDGGQPGGIVALYAFVGKHRRALRYDFRRHFGVALDEIGRSIPFSEAIDLVTELEHDFGSHLTASVAGWEFAISYGEFITWLHATAFVNSNRDPKQTPKPIELPVPWDRGRPAAEQVTDEERAALKAKLLRHSAFAE